MSFSGLKQFEQNLNTLMNSQSFKNSSDSKKFELGYRLLNSCYGVGSFFGFGKVKEPKKTGEIMTTPK